MATKLMRMFYPLVCMAVISVVSMPVHAADPNGRVSVAVISAHSPVFDEVTEVIREELGNGFRVWVRCNDHMTTADTLARLLEVNNTDIAVLMDNRSITLFKKYQELLPDSAVVIPSVSCLGVSIQQEVGQLRNAAGVSYEVPLVTAATALRSIMKTPLRRLGVVHRDIMTEFVARNTPFCVQEEIEIVSYAVPGDADKMSGKVRKGLKQLLAGENVDALWVPNDIALLKPEIIREVWIPLVKRYRKPVIVGIEKLADPALQFGTFAVLPDDRGIGIQVAGMILDAQENGWMFTGHPVEFPVSVVKILNRRQAGRIRGGINGGNDGIDKVLE